MESIKENFSKELFSGKYSTKCNSTKHNVIVTKSEFTLLNEIEYLMG